MNEEEEQSLIREKFTEEESVANVEQNIPADI